YTSVKPMNLDNSENEKFKFRINYMIKKYEKGKHQVAFSTFNDLKNEPNLDSKTSHLAKYYLALCYIHEHGVSQNKAYALRTANNFYNNNKYEDAWNIYRELTKDDEMKLKALINMAEYYMYK
ncbi:7699_t:CDS:1, partial [Cetraspora pellucida]